MWSPQKAEKVCIFCGIKPEGKSKEHVLPQWLMKLTGDPKRQVVMGETVKNGKQKIRVFSFDQFTFPACTQCNNDYSELESRVQTIVSDLLAKRAISEVDCNIFLDWLDKVRIGLWLGNRYLTDNKSDVVPNFYISGRIGNADRMAWIMRGDLADGLSMLGSQTPMFSIMPSVFGLRINDMMIISGSTDLMISERLGFPYASKRWTELGERRTGMQIARGTGRIVSPIFHVQPRLASLRIYQPIFSKFLDESDGPFSDPYVKSLALDWQKGRGRVFVDGVGGLKPGGVDAVDHMMSEGLLRTDWIGQFGASVLEVQNGLVATLPSLGKLPPHVRRFEARRWRFLYGYNRSAIKAYLDDRVLKSMAELQSADAEGQVFMPS